MRKIKSVIFIAVFLVVGVAWGQTITSLYSSHGIGEVSEVGLQQNFSMGNIGYGTPSLFGINLQNPSMLFYNPLSSFSVGLMGDFRTYDGQGISDNSNAVSLRYLAMAFPVVESRWATAFSLLPYSSVNYNSYSIDSLSNGVAAINQYQGNGGLSSLSWSNSIRLYKSLAIGIKSSFVFGTIEKDSRVQLAGEDIESTYVISYTEDATYKDIIFSLSISNKFKLANKSYLNVGAVYNLSGELNGELATGYERYSGSTLLQEVSFTTESAAFNLPRSIGAGLSYQIVNKLLIGADLDIKQWPESSESENANYNNAMSLSLGGELIPDIQSVSSYFKRARYRAGINYKELPYLVENTQINDFGINFGVALPVSGYSSIETAFKYGWRGTTDNGLTRESYFQVVLGATINDRWFIKRKYD
ncbi:MAG: hypothetical protein KI791_14210 [Cyclobacteriaceae bacterium]|nr:hypothetical protein [Cyclobacteriaceae bacterium SS2]